MAKDTVWSDESWFLVHCKRGQEARALANLTEQEYVCYLPAIDRAEGATDGKLASQGTKQPLFPGYMFVRLFPDSNWHSLGCTRGVLRVVGFNNRPYPVRNELIEQIKDRCKGYKAPSPGSKVQVRIGPNLDIDAVFLASDGPERAILLLKLLNQYCRLTVATTTIHADNP